MNKNAKLIRFTANKTNNNQNICDVFDLLFDKQLLIGRDIDCDFRINSLEVSRRHATIEYKDNNWVITDLESTNGLYINGQQLEELVPYSLKNGDKLSFGPLFRSHIIYEFINNLCSNNSLFMSSKRKLSDQNSRQLVSKRLCRQSEEFEELFDSELSCSICHELFVSAVTLNCSHTFCLNCIEEWKGSNRNNPKANQNSIENTPTHTNCCPICRQTIVSQNKVLVLDNVIDYLVNKLSPKLSDQRRKLITQRKHLSYI